MLLRLTTLMILLLCTGLVRAQPQWINSIGGNNTEEGYAISVDGAGNTYSTGYFTGNADFNAITLSSSGATDAYVVMTNSNGQIQWAVKLGGAGVDRGLDIKADNAGNTYVTGFYSGNATFGAINLNSVGGSQDVFIAKLDPTGTVLWAVSAGGTSVEQGNGIDLDGAGNVLVTGQFRGTATFGATNLTSMTDPTTSQPSTDIFTTKLTNAGAFQWAKMGTAKFLDRGLDVAADNAGNVYVTGQFSDTITFDNTYNNQIQNAIFVVKYDPNGNELWFRRAGGGTLSISYGIDASPAGDVFLTGDFLGNLTFFGPPNNTLTSTYSDRIFVVRYNTAGDYQWGTTMGSDNLVSSRDIVLDDSLNTYIVGHFECSFTEMAQAYGDGIFLTVGYKDVYVAKHNVSGAWQWSRQMGGKQDDLAGGIALHDYDGPSITGTYSDRMNVPSSPSFVFTPVSFGTSTLAPGVFCGESSYNTYYQTISQGVTDVFIQRPIDLARAPYDFFERTNADCSKDIMPPYVWTNHFLGSNPPDTLYACGPGCGGGQTCISVFPSTDANVGPDYTYLWNTGATGTTICLTNPGWYWCTVTSADGCFTRQDSLYVVFTPGHQLEISDDVVVQTNTGCPYVIFVCNPDTVTLSGGNYAGVNVDWSGTAPFTYIDSVTIQVTQSGTYTFFPENPTCEYANYVDIVFDDSVQLDSIVPMIHVWEDTLDNNDTIEICDNEFINFHVYDSITNPNGHPAIMDNSYGIWSSVPAGVFVGNGAWDFNVGTGSPNTTGWYHVHADIAIYWSNTCGQDTVWYPIDDSIYVIVHPNPTPTVTISSPSGTSPLYICEGDTVQLDVTASSPHTWNAGNYIGAPTDPSILVFEEGWYGVSVIETDPVTGCTGAAGASFQVIYKTAPTLTSPAQYICPGDSVLISVGGTGDFQWYGPSGPFGPNSDSVYISDPGFYYAIIHDVDSCEFVTNTIELVLFNTPYISGSPAGHLCPGDPGITIEVVSIDTSSITWLAPLSGNSTTQFVTSAGVYTAEVVACNTTTTATITVTSSNPSVSVVANGPTNFCVGDSVELAAPGNGIDFYDWQPGSQTDSTIFVSLPGTYYVVGTDQYGCVDTSGTITITNESPVPSPQASDTVICVNSTVQLSATGSGTLTWTDSLGNPLGTGPTYTTGVISDTTLYYVVATNTVSGCDSPPTPVWVYINPISEGIGISAIGTYCEGSSIFLNADTYPGATYSWTGPGAFTASTEDVTILSASMSDEGWYIVQVDDGQCTSPGDSVYVTINPVPSAPTIFGTDSLCEGDSIILSVVPVPGLDYNWSGPNSFNDTALTIVIAPADTTDGGLYAVTATENGCISAPGFFQVVVVPGAHPTISNNGPLCEGDTLIAVVTVESSATFGWYDASGLIGLDDTLIVPGMGEVNGQTGHYIIAERNGCTSEPVYVITTVFAYPEIGLPDTIYVCEDSLVQVQAATGYTSYLWHDFSTNSYFITDDPGTIYVDVMNGHCPESDTTYIRHLNCDMTVPNVFTPNGDGINDVFFFVSEATQSLYIEIYNRWGTLVGIANDPDLGWNGRHYKTDKPLADGVYYYIGHLVNFAGKQLQAHGFVHLFRER